MTMASFSLLKIYSYYKGNISYFFVIQHVVFCISNKGVNNNCLSDVGKNSDIVKALALNLILLPRQSVVKSRFNIAGKRSAQTRLHACVLRTKKS